MSIISAIVICLIIILVIYLSLSYMNKWWPFKKIIVAPSSSLLATAHAADDVSLCDTLHLDIQQLLGEINKQQSDGMSKVNMLFGVFMDLSRSELVQVMYRIKQRWTNIPAILDFIRALNNISLMIDEFREALDLFEVILRDDKFFTTNSVEDFFEILREPLNRSLDKCITTTVDLDEPIDVQNYKTNIYYEVLPLLNDKITVDSKKYHVTMFISDFNSIMDVIAFYDKVYNTCRVNYVTVSDRKKSKTSMNDALARINATITLMTPLVDRMDEIMKDAKTI